MLAKYSCWEKHKAIRGQFQRQLERGLTAVEMRLRCLGGSQCLTVTLHAYLSAFLMIRLDFGNGRIFALRLGLFAVCRAAAARRSSLFQGSSLGCFLNGSRTLSPLIHFRLGAWLRASTAAFHRVNGIEHIERDESASDRSSGALSCSTRKFLGRNFDRDFSTLARRVARVVAVAVEGRLGPKILVASWAHTRCLRVDRSILVCLHMQWEFVRRGLVMGQELWKAFWVDQSKRAPLCSHADVGSVLVVFDSLSTLAARKAHGAGGVVGANSTKAVLRKQLLRSLLSQLVNQQRAGSVYVSGGAGLELTNASPGGD